MYVGISCYVVSEIISALQSTLKPARQNWDWLRENVFVHAPIMGQCGAQLVDLAGYHVHYPLKPHGCLSSCMVWIWLSDVTAQWAV